MAARSRRAARSTSAGVTSYSLNGEFTPTKKFQTASCTAAEVFLNRPLFTCVSTTRAKGSLNVTVRLLMNTRCHIQPGNQPESHDLNFVALPRIGGQCWGDCVS